MPILAILHRPAWRLALAIAVLALVPILLAPARAQALDPQAAVTAGTTRLELGPDDQGTATWTVRNVGGLDADASVTLQVPGGWTATLAPGDASFRLAAGSARTLIVPVTAVGPAPADAVLALSATLTDDLGRASPPASAGTQLAFLPPPPPPPPRDYTAEILAGILGSLAFLAAAAALAVYLVRARQVAVHVDGVQRPVTSGSDGVFLVQVENLGKVRREVEVRVDGLPPTWYGAFSFPKVQLQPGERSPVPLCIKVPLAAADGAAVDVVLRARPGRRFPWLVRAVTRIEAHDRVVIGPSRLGPATPAGAPPASSDAASAGPANTRADAAAAGRKRRAPRAAA